MNAKLQKAKKSNKKELKKAAFCRNSKQSIKLLKKKNCWILKRLNWSEWDIARTIDRSNHTVKEYISEVENDPLLKAEASTVRPKKVKRKKKSIEAIEFNIQSNQSFARRTIGTRHNYDKQKDDY